MFIVLDTNVLVSALITPFGNSARILDMVICGNVKILYDDRILTEYREVLLRKKFNFRENDVDTLLEYLETEGLRITSGVCKENLPDKDDIPFLEVALSGNARALIAGNKRHFKIKFLKDLKIMSPEEFLKFWKKKKKQE